MITTRMAFSRRAALLTILASPAAIRPQEPQEHRLPLPPDPNEDQKLPNGKSQKDAMAKQSHEDALKDAESLVSVAQELLEEIKKAGNYVIPVGSVKKTEEIEKLARRIRARLKA